MFTMRRFLGIGLVGLLAPLLSLGVDTGGANATVSGPSSGTATAARGTTSPCHGYVYRFRKNQSTNRIRMTYWVYCSRHVDYIQVHAFLREGDRWAYTGTPHCRDTYVCKAVATMRDRAGSQLYTARAVEGGDLADVTYVKDGAHSLWSCGGGATGWGDPMNCGGAGKKW